MLLTGNQSVQWVNCCTWPVVYWGGNQINRSGRERGRAALNLSCHIAAVWRIKRPPSWDAARWLREWDRTPLLMSCLGWWRSSRLRGEGWTTTGLSRRSARCTLPKSNLTLSSCTQPFKTTHRFISLLLCRTEKKRFCRIQLQTVTIRQ